MDDVSGAPEYLKRYEADDNGLRFQDLVYQGNFKGMEPVPDGILGDKMLKQRAKSKVLEKVSHEDVVRGSSRSTNSTTSTIIWPGTFGMFWLCARPKVCRA